MASKPLIGIIISFCVMLIVSWRRWTSPIIDSGREMDLPLRLLEGELLYRDIHYLYPPFSPYFNAQLYRIFGVHLDLLLVSGVVCSALIVLISYRVARRLLAPPEAATAMLAVIVLCIFKPAGNLISPYAFSALYGAIFALAALLFSLRYSEKGKRRELIAAGIFIGLAAITKQEFALAGSITLMVMLFYQHRAGLHRMMVDLSVAALPAAIVAVPCYLLLFYLVGWRTLVQDCHLFYTHMPASLIFYNGHRTGLTRPLFSFIQMTGAAAVVTSALSAIILLSDRTRKFFNIAGIIFLNSLIVVFTIKLIAGKQWDGSPLRAIPLMLLAMILWEWRRNHSPALLIISVYSLAVLFRVTLRVPSGGAFGGYFLPTALILFSYLFLKALPQALERWTKDSITVRTARLIGQALLLSTLIVTAIVFGVRYRKNFTYEISTPRGSLLVRRSSGSAIAEALNFIETETKPGEAIAVLPEGSDLSFLAGRRMPLRHQILIPGLMSEEDERRAITKLEEEGVRYVLIVNRPMREFGAEAFGRDFYRTLGQWVDDHYRLVKVCGQISDEDLEIGDQPFFIKIYMKR
jgi:4-amino-4-deoxy-L-arabinose transferase-like glycosyltransferase